MGRLVPAVTRALDILELFLDGDGTLSAPDIVRRLRLPRTTVHELVTTLAARSYLVPVPGRPGRYRLGVRPFQLGSRYAEQFDLAAEGQRVARAIADTCDETVHVAILEGTDIIHLAQAGPRTGPAPGHRLPAHCTAAGKLLLAALPTTELTARFPNGTELPALTPHSITDPGTLRATLTDIREHAIATESRESAPAVSSLAAPVHDHTGEIVAALSISVPLPHWTQERRAELELLATKGAAELSGCLGCGGAA
ncbi:IclR family transcriptional regulator [Streptomyces sp. LP11]|uniref:IclR family transcriptional regulator n=1 Tax=Streptomyces pyxinicus TaxID=2970331 RepID=A0ABT2AYM5_9ACTN|nr:IclR family transcriptional regulator [Streptomyces sp. LP11]MCS0601352.1 IclR family transcriptional regulator [Streptomyces sp. LP11]